MRSSGAVRATPKDLSEEDKDQWDALEWDEDGSVPNRVEAEAVDKWLFNKDTLDKVLEHLMTRGLTVAGGDRLGKMTILFAKNQHDSLGSAPTCRCRTG